MFNVIEATPSHIIQLLDDPLNQDIVSWRGTNKPKNIIRNSHFRWTFIHDEKVLASIGVVQMWERRGAIWSIFSLAAKPHSVALYRRLKAAIPLLPFDRVEMDVPVDMDLAHRRAKFLGFKLECALAKKFLPDGSDASLYAWVRE